MNKSILAALAFAGLTGAARAEPTELWLAGAETSGDASFMFLGYVAPVGEGHLGDGLVQRYWIDWSRYRYDRAGTQIDASAPGVEAALGWQKGYESGWWAAYLGAAYRNTSLSPDDPTSAVRGSMLRPKLQLEGEFNLPAEWRISGIASYIGGQDAWFLRGRLLHGVPGDWRWGGEASWQGDPSYRANQQGAVLVLPRTAGGWDFGFKLGSRQVGGVAARAYAGIEAGAAF